MSQHQVTCPVCHGKKGSSSPNRDGTLTFLACARCGSRGTIWEDASVAARRVVISPRKTVPADPNYPLVGTWRTEGGYWNVTWAGQNYRVESFGALGKAGEGTVVHFDGRLVLVNLKNLMILPGSNAYMLELDGNLLRGKALVFGVEVAIVLQRET